MRTAKEKLEDNEIFDEVELIDDVAFCDALIGVTMLPELRAVYSYEKLVEEYMDKCDCSYDEASDYVSYNIVRGLGYMGDNSPIVVDMLEG